jgi:hypothetical protein
MSETILSFVGPTNEGGARSRNLASAPPYPVTGSREDPEPRLTVDTDGQQRPACPRADSPQRGLARVVRRRIWSAQEDSTYDRSLKSRQCRTQSHLPPRPHLPKLGRGECCKRSCLRRLSCCRQFLRQLRYGDGRGSPFPCSQRVAASDSWPDWREERSKS